MYKRKPPAVPLLTRVPWWDAGVMTLDGADSEHPGCRAVGVSSAFQRARSSWILSSRSPSWGRSSLVRREPQLPSLPGWGIIGPWYLLGELPPLPPAPNVPVPTEKGLWQYARCSMLSSHFRYVSLCIPTGIEHLKFLITGLVSICHSRVLAFKGLFCYFEFTLYQWKLCYFLSTIEVGHLGSFALAARRRSFSQGHSPFSRQDFQALSRFYREICWAQGYL